MDDDDCSLHVALDDTLVALAMRIVIGESQVIVFPRGVFNPEISNSEPGTAGNEFGITSPAYC